MRAIRSLRLLPPFAVGRFGSSDCPLDSYELKLDSDRPLDFRTIVPKESLEIDPRTGVVVRSYTPNSIRFRDGDRIRPVAPFLELFAETEKGELRPVTLSLLAEEGLDASSISWWVQVANLKIFRYTGNAKDRVLAEVKPFSDHEVHPLRGVAVHFLKDRFIPFGDVRYIRPTREFPEIRLRFTPGKGLVYGTDPDMIPQEGGGVDPVFKDHPERIVYDKTRGKWYGYQADVQSRTNPNPSDVYQGTWPDDDGLPVGWGYLDDVCDGRVCVELQTKEGRRLTASAWISACMPAFAPDSLPMRTVADELEQLILGHEIADDEVSIDEAGEIVRRALESIRLMNTAAMNANVINGRTNIASTLYRQDTNDAGRDYSPAMASSLVDNFAVQALHHRIYAALKSGTAPWFARVMRQPEEVGDLSDEARRKMPPMLRGADSRALTLTRRQISKVVKAATRGLFEATPTASPKVQAMNLMAQLHHQAKGNPYSTLPSSAISNCFPGLEFDFKNFWRRSLVGIVFQEFDNLVVAVEDPRYADLKEHRLLMVEGQPIVVTVRGPVMPGGESRDLPLGNPEPIAIEWSNALAFIRSHHGQTVKCHFTAKRTNDPVNVPKDVTKMKVVEMQVRPIFEKDSLAVSQGYLEPGELTQGLCSPWQHDYRECACYYWPASRPDYVNLTQGPDGVSRGDNWLSLERKTGEYVLDDRKDSRLVTYQQLFEDWERHLHFQIRGQDSESS
jgi:hypothetical protein